MGKVLSIKELTELAQPIIEIPGFNVGETIFVRVKKPSVLSMLANGDMPNHLLGTAEKMVGIKSSKPKKEEDKKLNEVERYKDITKLLELYCTLCLVEPSYEDFKDIMTDQQKEAIFDWGMGGMAKANTFHNEEEIQSDNNDGEEISGKAK